jgi:hypothetical protein
MSKHEFYADPTLFDHWHSRAGNWLVVCGEKTCPYLWTIAFALAATTLVSVSLLVVGISVRDTAAYLPPTWNRLLAQGITTVTALAAAQYLYQQAINAWPEDHKLPAWLHEAGHYVGWKPAVKVRPVKVITPKTAGDPARPAKPVVDREAVQAFFAGVRAAGVNVAIAKALFAAGIRSPQQLLQASDRQLVAIRGVGPATVHKLRVQFGKQA